MRFIPERESGDFVFYKARTDTALRLPYIGNPVQAGFPSMAMDYTEKDLDLNEHLVANKEATFFIMVKGDSMRDAHICNGDMLIVDRSIEPANGRVALCIINGEYTVKTLRAFEKNGRKELTLMPANPEFKPIPITESSEFEVWGIVTHVIHEL